MSAVLSIWRRELQAYFVSPIAYVVIVIFLGITGLGFLRSLLLYSNLPEIVMESRGFTIRTWVVRDLTLWINVGMMFSLPALSMRVFSEERKVGTVELLMTSPITTAQLVLGKFFGALSVFGLMLSLTTVFVSVLLWQGQPELAALGVAYLGYFLFGAVILAIGVFASSLTENQIVALLLTYAIFLPLAIVDLVMAFVGRPWSDVLAAVSIRNAMKTFGHGLMDTHYLALNAGLVFLFLFLCAQVIDSTRWR